MGQSDYKIFVRGVKPDKLHEGQSAINPSLNGCVKKNLYNLVYIGMYKNKIFNLNES